MIKWLALVVQEEQNVKRIISTLCLIIWVHIGLNQVPEKQKFTDMPELTFSTYKAGIINSYLSTPEKQGIPLQCDLFMPLRFIICIF